MGEPGRVVGVLQPIAKTSPTTRVLVHAGTTAAVGVIVLLGLALRLYWSLLVPYNDAPDEYCHWPMVRLIAEEGRFPTMADVPGRVPVSYPAMSPLGYVALAIPVAVLGADDPYGWISARIVNALIGSLSLVFVYMGTREFIPSRPRVALLTMTLAALHPQLVFISSYINNDCSMLLGVSIVWWLWMKLGQRGPSIARGIGLGLATGATILLKLNAVGVVLAGLPIILVGLLEGKWRSWGTCMLCALGTAGSVLSPWLLWNHRQHGSLFGTDIHDAWWRNHIEEIGVRPGYLTWEKVGDFLTGTWESSWGTFGYAATPLSPVSFVLITAVVGLAAGVAIRSRGDDSSKTASRGMIACLLLGTILCWGSHAYHSALFGMTAQGRYVLPATWPILVLLSVGAWELPRIRGMAWGPIAIVGLFSYLAWDGVAVEQESNRIGQSDRRVRSRLLANADRLPGETRWRIAEGRVLGPSGIDLGGVTSKPLLMGTGEIVRLSEPMLGEDLAWVMIAQYWRSGKSSKGYLRIREAEGTGNLLAEITYEDHRVGTASYRFDLRRLHANWKGRRVWVEIAPSSEACIVELSRCETFGSDRVPR